MQLWVDLSFKICPNPLFLPAEKDSILYYNLVSFLCHLLGNDLAMYPWKISRFLLPKVKNGVTCLATAWCEMNMLCQDLIKPDLQEKFSQLCKPTVPITENLFGDDLTKHIKDIDEVHKTKTFPEADNNEAAQATVKMAKQPRFVPYSYTRRGHGGRGYPYNNALFLGRGGAQSQHQPFKLGRGLLSAKRGRGRGARRGQQQ